VKEDRKRRLEAAAESEGRKREGGTPETKKRNEHNTIF